MEDQRPRKKGTPKPKRVKKTSRNRTFTMFVTLLSFIICMTQFLGLISGIYEVVMDNEDPIRVIFLAIEILQMLEVIPSAQVILWGISSTISGILMPIIAKWVH